VAVKTESATTVTNHTRNARAAQREDQIDFPCSEVFLRHYYRTGLSPYSMGQRRRSSTPRRSQQPINRSVAEPLTTELERLRYENTKLRCEKHELGKQKNQIEIELRILRERMAATQKRQTTFRGIPSVEFTRSTD